MTPAPLSPEALRRRSDITRLAFATTEELVDGHQLLGQERARSALEFGVGIRQDIGKAGLNLDYTYSTGRTRIAYAYTVGGAINAATAPAAGNRMPDLATDARYLDASFRYPLTARITARFLYRYQTETIRDWHYQNLDALPVVPAANGAAGLPTVVALDGGRYNYRVNWYGVMLQLKL